MGTTVDWRSPDYADQFDGYERPDFAQEFLRRNPAYIASYQRAKHSADILKEVAVRWGLTVAFDPNLSANQTKALWDHNYNPMSVEVRGESIKFDSVAEQHDTATFRNMLLADEDGNHYVIWRKTGGKEYQIIVPMCCDTAQKLKAAYRFWRHIEGKTAGAYPSPYRLTEQQRKRLSDALQIIDSEKSGLSKRKVAEILYDETISLRSWSDSSERAHMRRLLKRGKYLSEEGYKRLLNPSSGGGPFQPV